MSGLKSFIGSVGKGIANAGETLTSKKDYVSTRPSNFGDTYTRYGGLVSVLKKGATPESIKQARAPGEAAQAAQTAARKKASSARLAGQTATNNASGYNTRGIKIDPRNRF